MLNSKKDHLGLSEYYTMMKDGRLIFGKGDLNPKDALDHIISEKVRSWESITIVCGFMTIAGFETLFGSLNNRTQITKIAKKTEFFLVGKLTEECAALFDRLLDENPDFKGKLLFNSGIGSFFIPHSKYESVDKGYVSVIGRNIKRIPEPMIHSKIYAINSESDENLFYVGSANLTRFALNNQNAEAGVLYENLSKTRKAPILQYLRQLKKTPGKCEI